MQPFNSIATEQTSLLSQQQHTSEDDERDPESLVIDNKSSKFSSLKKIKFLLSIWLFAFVLFLNGIFIFKGFSSYSYLSNDLASSLPVPTNSTNFEYSNSTTSTINGTNIETPNGDESINKATNSTTSTINGTNIEAPNGDESINAYEPTNVWEWIVYEILFDIPLTCLFFYALYLSGQCIINFFTGIFSFLIGICTC